MPRVAKPKPAAAAEFSALPLSTTIDVVAITPEGTFIFAMSLEQWLKIKKKPGVQYIAYQEGAAQFKDAVRTEYKF